MNDKRKKFKRLVELRVNRTLKDLKLISNLSNTSNYSYTEAEIKKVFNIIDESVRQTKLCFKKKRKTFSLD